MAKILFIQSEPRSVKKVGPIRQKRGDSVEQRSVNDPVSSFVPDIKPDVVVIDLAAPAGAAAILESLSKAGFLQRPILVTNDADAAKDLHVIPSNPGTLSLAIDKILGEMV